MNLDDARRLAIDLIRIHLDDGWTFRWSNAHREFGRCNYTHRRIVLSKPLTLTNDEHQVRDTILHEIAHALTPVTESPHGPAWKANCRKVGAQPVARYDARTVAKSAAPPAGRWYGICTKGCGWGPVTRLRLTDRLRKYGLCGDCRSPLHWERRSQ